MSLKSICVQPQKNARYTSAPIQNQLIECAGKVISHKLVEEINESGVFAILADESTDCSNKEQLAPEIRFVYIYINRIRMFVCLSVGYTLLIKPNSIHMLYMGSSEIYRGRFLSKN